MAKPFNLAVSQYLELKTYPPDDNYQANSSRKKAKTTRKLVYFFIVPLLSQHLHTSWSESDNLTLIAYMCVVLFSNLCTNCARHGDLLCFSLLSSSHLFSCDIRFLWAATQKRFKSGNCLWTFFWKVSFPLSLLSVFSLFTVFFFPIYFHLFCRWIFCRFIPALLRTKR